MKIPPDALTRKALIALEEICGSHDGRFERSMALRFILAYLYAVSKSPKGRQPFDDLWNAGRFRHPHSKEMADTCRSQDVNMHMNGIYNAVGVHRSTDLQFWMVRQKQQRGEKRKRNEAGY